MATTCSRFRGDAASSANVASKFAVRVSAFKRAMKPYDLLLHRFGLHGIPQLAKSCGERV